MHPSSMSIMLRSFRLRLNANGTVPPARVASTCCGGSVLPPPNPAAAPNRLFTILQVKLVKDAAYFTTANVLSAPDSGS